MTQNTHLVKNFDLFYADRATRAMLNLLADGSWHDKVDVLAEAAPHVGVSTGYRNSRGTGMGSGGNTSQARIVKAAQGQREAVRTRIYTHTRDGRIESHPTEADRLRLRPDVAAQWRDYVTEQQTR
jgi:hypothetical protein